MAASAPDPQLYAVVDKKKKENTDKKRVQFEHYDFPRSPAKTQQPMGEMRGLEDDDVIMWENADLYEGTDAASVVVFEENELYVPTSHADLDLDLNFDLDVGKSEGKSGGKSGGNFRKNLATHKLRSSYENVYEGPW